MTDKHLKASGEHPKMLPPKDWLPPDTNVRVSLLGWAYFMVGFLVFAMALVVTGYVVFFQPNLSEEGRWIIRWWLLPLASGFIAAAFTGGMYTRFKGGSGLAASATGGFGVWLTTILLVYFSR